MVMHKYISIINLAVSFIMLFQTSVFADDNLSQIGAGFMGTHSGMIQNDGKLFMWGSNQHGELGIATYDEGGEDKVDKPRYVLNDAKFISLGQDFSALIKTDDTLWMTGVNNIGQLGDGTTIDKSEFKKIMNDVSFVSSGGAHSLAVQKDGSLWVWGYNGFGQLCNGTNSNTSLTPQKIMDGVKAAYAGYGHTAIIKQDGTLLMCGWNAKGQLGLGYDSGVESNPKELNFFDDGGNKIPVKQVTLGAYDTFFLLEDDTLWYAGRDMSGESCLGDDFSYSSTPVKVSDNVKLARIGDSFSTFVTKDDVQYLCGRGHSCTIPPSANNGKKISTPKKGFVDVEDVQIGAHYLLLLGKEGSAIAWGDNSEGQLGINSQAEYRCIYGYVQVPIAVVDIPQGPILEFNGQEQVGIEAKTGYTVTGNTGRNVGIYKATLKLVQDYVWSDGSTEDKEVEWQIIKSPNSPFIIDIPQGQTLEFNGRVQKGVKSGNGYNITGNTRKEVGKYKATLKLVQDYEWSDGTTEDKVVGWEIVKGKNPVTVTGKQVKVNYKKLKRNNIVIARQQVLKIEQNEGLLFFKKSSGNNKILINTATGSVKVSKGLKKGSYNIRVKVTAKGNKNYQAGSQTATVRIVVK